MRYTLFGRQSRSSYLPWHLCVCVCVCLCVHQHFLGGGIVGWEVESWI